MQGARVAHFAHKKDSKRADNCFVLKSLIVNPYNVVALAHVGKLKRKVIHNNFKVS